MGTPVSSGNRGVLALGASLCSLCAGDDASNVVTLLIGRRDNAPANFRINGQWSSIPVINVRLSPRSKLREHLAWVFLMSAAYRCFPFSFIRKHIAKSTPWIKAVSESDIVGNIHGGDSFSDIYGLKGFILTCAMDFSVIWVKGSILLFPQTYGPYKTGLARFLAKAILKRSSFVVARDKQSREVAVSLIGANAKVALCPDVAFALESTVPQTLIFDPPLPSDRKAKPIGINVNGLMFNGGYTRNNMFGLKLDYAKWLPELVESLLRNTTSEVWLVPHTYAPPNDTESDPQACKLLRDSLPAEIRDRVRILASEYNQYELKGVIGLCDFFIGSRMHSCVAALSQGIPCVGVAYSMKFYGVFETVGLESFVVDGRTTEDKDATKTILALYRDREIFRPSLKEKSKAARLELEAMFATTLLVSDFSTANQI